MMYLREIAQQKTDANKKPGALRVQAIIVHREAKDKARRDQATFAFRRNGFESKRPLLFNVASATFRCARNSIA
jgi:hypothetical protein